MPQVEITTGWCNTRLDPFPHNQGRGGLPRLLNLLFHLLHHLRPHATHVLHHLLEVREIDRSETSILRIVSTCQHSETTHRHERVSLYAGGTSLTLSCLCDHFSTPGFSRNLSIPCPPQTRLGTTFTLP